jgi:hypothetical protein
MSGSGLRSELHRFALWMSTTWDEENEDDVAASLAVVDEFLAAGDPNALGGPHGEGSEE